MPDRRMVDPSQLSPNEYLAYLEDQNGTIDNFGRAWYGGDDELRNVIQEGMEFFRAETPEGLDPEEYWCWRFREGPGTTRQTVEHHVRVATSLLDESERQQIADVPVGVISRMGINAGVVPVPSGGHVVFVEWGTCSQLVATNIIANRIHGMYRGFAGRRIDPFMLLFRHADQLISAPSIDEGIASDFSPEENHFAERIMQIQLWFILLHEFAHLLLGHLSILGPPGFGQGGDPRVRIEGDSTWHEMELAADQLAVRRLLRLRDLLPELANAEVIDLLIPSLTVLFSAQRFPELARGNPLVASVSHPDPADRLRRVLIAVTDGDHARVGEAMLLSSRLDWAASLGRIATRLRVDQESLYVPPEPGGQVTLATYLLGALGAELVNVCRHRSLLPMASDPRAPRELRARVEGTIREGHEVAEECARRIIVLAGRLGVEGMSVGQLTTLPDERDVWDPEYGFYLGEILQSMDAHSLRLRSGPVAQEVPEEPGCSVIGHRLGLARLQCGDIAHNMIQAGLVDWKLLEALEASERFTAAQTEGIARVREQYEAVSASAAAHFKPERGLVTKYVEEALSMWQLLRQSSGRAWHPDAEGLVIGAVRERFAAMVSASRITPDDLRDTALLLDDLAWVIAHDLSV